MSKTKEELDALKEEVNNVNEKLKELTPEELEQVNGGVPCSKKEVLTAVGGALAVGNTFATLGAVTYR